MFTGIIDHCGEILEIERKPASVSFLVRCKFSDLVEGESIAVDGACLTVVAPGENIFRCDVSPETLNLTTASHYRQGTLVNLERALRMGDRLGGHFVMGHVDSKVSVKEIDAQAEFVRVVFTGVSSALARYLVKKGSVAVSGVSLTVNACSAFDFEVMVIPHTLQRTNLSALTKGCEVNVEFDWLTKIILNDVQRTRENLLNP